MSNFLDELRDDIGRLGLADGWSSNLKDVRECQETLDLLGENARRMLEIGVLQDELVKLGFSRFGLYEYTLLDKMYNQLVSVDFINLIITTSFYGGEQYYYSYASLTWQQDVLTKVKELMK